jgi:hypothetical protein
LNSLKGEREETTQPESPGKKSAKSCYQKTRNKLNSINAQQRGTGDPLIQYTKEVCSRAEITALDSNPNFHQQNDNPNSTIQKFSFDSIYKISLER